MGDWHPFQVVLGQAYRGLTGGFLLLRIISVAISVIPLVCFTEVLILIPKMMYLWARNFPCKPKNLLSEEPKQNKGRGLLDHKLVEAPSNLIADHPNAAVLFWFFCGFTYGVRLCFVILVRYKNKKIGKIDVQC